MYRFSHEHDGEISIKAHSADDLTTADLCRMFEEFMRGCGFVIPDDVHLTWMEEDIEEEEIPPADYLACEKPIAAQCDCAVEE